MKILYEFPKRIVRNVSTKEVDFKEQESICLNLDRCFLALSKLPHLSSTPFTNLVQTNFPRRQRFGRAIRQLDNQFSISINGCRNAAEVLPVLGKSDVFANHKGALPVFF